MTRIQEVIEAVESLQPDDREVVLDVVKNRMIQRRRARLIKEVEEARADYIRGNVKRGNVKDLMAEITM